MPNNAETEVEKEARTVELSHLFSLILNLSVIIMYFRRYTSSDQFIAKNSGKGRVSIFWPSLCRKSAKIWGTFIRTVLWEQ